MTKKVYSLNEEDFCYETVGEVFDCLESDGEFKEGAEYWEADAHQPKAAEFFNANHVIDNAAECACDEGGDYAEDFGSVSDEATAELQALLSQWANKHCIVNFWTVSNVKKMTVTAEDVADTGGNRGA